MPSKTVSDTGGGIMRLQSVFGYQLYLPATIPHRKVNG